MKLSVVVATADPEKTRDFWSTWRKNAAGDFEAIIVWTGHSVDGWPPRERGELSRLCGLLQPGDTVLRFEGFGVVPAYVAGLAYASGDIIACLHDDLAIHSTGWDRAIINHFELRPKCGLVGFGGALGLGDSDIYEKPYQPMQLARQNFFSNMRDAEAHGKRAYWALKVACLDGFSLIGRREFMVKAGQALENSQIIHHAYDSLLGVLAAKWGWEVWMLPVACHHHGGMTAVGNSKYIEWALQQRPRGDAEFWEEAHQFLYEEGRGVLPLRIGE